MPQYIKRSLGLTLTDAPSLPPVAALGTTLIIPPGGYSYNGQSYDMRAEGLYHVLNPGVSGGYYIVYQSDVPALMSALAWLCVYGKADEGLTQAQKVDAARSRKLALRCEPVTDFVLAVCAAQNVTARKVRLLTATTPTNWDDGHVVTEAKVNGAWRAFDVALDASFQKADADLSLKDIFNGGWDEVVPLAPTEADNDNGGNNVLHTGIYADLFIRTDADRAAWRSRVFQIPGIVHTDGLTYFYMPAGTEARQAWLLGLSTNYRVVSQATWTSMFYT